MMEFPERYCRLQEKSPQKSGKTPGQIWIGVRKTPCLKFELKNLVLKIQFSHSYYGKSGRTLFIPSYKQWH